MTIPPSVTHQLTLTSFKVFVFIISQNNTQLNESMALSYLSEGEAPRDFKVSSTESDGHYTKCLLCYTVKRNFYCQDCIKAGSFVHTSMPYSDRFSEKQAKLLRLKANRKHVLDRCEKLLSGKIKKDNLLTEAKQSRDRLDLLRLAIEQRRNNIDEKRKALMELKQYNHDLSMKLPRYQKRVSLLGKHAQDQRIQLQNKMSTYGEQADQLAALRRSRIRQLIKYIFPVYISYDTSDSIEDMEFVGEDAEEEPPSRAQLHIVAPWIGTDGDLSHVQTWLAQNKEAGSAQEGSVAASAWRRTQAALALAAQLVALLAWTLDMRPPHAIALSDYCNYQRVTSTGLANRSRWLMATCCALCWRAGLTAPAAPHALAALHTLALAANADDRMLGRVEAWASDSLPAECVWEEWAGAEGDDCEPEHLHWPETMDEMEELSVTPPAAPPASLVTSAAASLASLWRGWHK
ncbi:hypothetical protein ABMA27_012978 [Loxostege sticticalis]|uniref:Beclin 1-associated autophagy-related key regulator n=1 Tax=Loxostege sticticalis TaxID=481309 RepID=A0ABR3IDL6_LOXSC